MLRKVIYVWITFYIYLRVKLFSKVEVIHKGELYHRYAIFNKHNSILWASSASIIYTDIKDRKDYRIANYTIFFHDGIIIKFFMINKMIEYMISCAYNNNTSSLEYYLDSYRINIIKYIRKNKTKIMSIIDEAYIKNNTCDEYILHFKINSDVAGIDTHAIYKYVYSDDASYTA